MPDKYIKKGIDKIEESRYNYIRGFGEVAQLARARVIPAMSAAQIRPSL